MTVNLKRFNKIKITDSGFKPSKIIILVMFVTFFVVYSFLFTSIDKKSGYSLLMPITVSTVLSTIFYLVVWWVVRLLYNYAKEKMNKANTVLPPDKLKIAMSIVLCLLIFPSFLGVMKGISNEGLLVFVLVLMLFLIPTWVLFSFVINIYLKASYIYFLIIIVAIIFLNGIFFQTSIFESLKLIEFLNGFMGFVAGLFFPSLVINLVFIEIPNYFKKRKSFNT